MVVQKLKNNGPVGLYLDLLKKALRRTVYTVEASEAANRRSPEAFITSNGLRFRGWRWRGPIIFQSASMTNSRAPWQAS